MAIKIMQDPDSYCARCKAFIPINHMAMIIKRNNGVESINICGWCASKWYDEIEHHFREWIAKGAPNG